jgi:hypothetical protein
MHHAARHLKSMACLSIFADFVKSVRRGPIARGVRLAGGRTPSQDRFAPTGERMGAIPDGLRRPV